MGGRGYDGESRDSGRCKSSVVVVEAHLKAGVKVEEELDQVRLIRGFDASREMVVQHPTFQRLIEGDHPTVYDLVFKPSVSIMLGVKDVFFYTALPSVDSYRAIGAEGEGLAFG